MRGLVKNYPDLSVSVQAGMIALGKTILCGVNMIPLNLCLVDSLVIQYQSYYNNQEGSFHVK